MTLYMGSLTLLLNLVKSDDSLQIKKVKQNEKTDSLRCSGGVTMKAVELQHPQSKMKLPNYNMLNASLK